MTMTAASVLIPLQIVSSMLLPGTSIAEPDLSRGEALWVPGASYQELRAEYVSDHVVYACTQVHSGRTVPPAQDVDYWKKKGPSNLFAPFDYYISTAAQAMGSLIYRMQPEFFSSVTIYGAQGDRVQITVREGPEPDSPVLAGLDEDLWEQALGLYELLFSPLGTRTKVALDNIPLSPQAVLEVTISSGAGNPVSVGTIAVGEWRSLVGDSPTGGTEFGAECEPKSNSFIKSYDDGTFEIMRRHSATDLSLSVVMDADQAEYAAATLQQVLDLPVAVRATNVPGYGYLNTMGLVSGVVRAKNAKEASGNYRVKGTI